MAFFWILGLMQKASFNITLIWGFIFHVQKNYFMSSSEPKHDFKASDKLEILFFFTFVILEIVF